jgi:glycosyltransferase involved in cell wall biosynthesis
MRVAVTLEQCWHRVPGGSARATLDAVSAVAARGGVEQVGVSAWHRRPPAEAWRPTIPVRPLPMPRVALYDSWQRLRRPRVERVTGAVDVVHATAHVASASRAPWVATVHDLHFLHEPDHFTPRGVRVFTRFVELVRAEAAAVVCPSEATRSDCVDAGIDAARLHVVPWAVADAPARPEAVDQARRRHGLDRPYVLFAGTVEPRKNVGRLVEAFARLGPVDAELVLVGPEGWGGIDTGSARRLGFLPRAELAALYAGAAAVCYPSLREGFGLPVLEAMAQGAPVVTSATTSTAEVAGDAAVLVDPEDVDQLAAALARLLADPELGRRVGAAARERAAGYTWARTAEGVVGAYRAAVGGER